MTARATSLAAVLLVAMCSAACGGKTSTPVSSVDAVIRVDCAVRDARVLINDRELGSVAQLARGIALSPGHHRLEVKHQGYHTHYAELDLEVREKRVINVELAERFP